MGVPVGRAVVGGTTPPPQRGAPSRRVGYARPRRRGTEQDAASPQARAPSGWSRRSAVHTSRAPSAPPSPHRPHVLAVASLAPHPGRAPARRPENGGPRDRRGDHGCHGGRIPHGGGVARDARRSARAAPRRDCNDDGVTPIRDRPAADRIAEKNRFRECRTCLAALQAGLGKPGGESAIPGHPVRLQTRLLALPGGAAARCGRAGARMPGTQRHRPAHGVPDASGLAGALRHQAWGCPAVL